MTPPRRNQGVPAATAPAHANGQPNMRAVAAAAGVSLSAVSLVLNGKPGVGPAKRARVLTTAEQLGYIPSGQRAASGVVLGLLMESLSDTANSDGYYARIIAGIEDAAQRLGYRLLLHLYRPGVDALDDLHALMGRPIDGLIVANDGDLTPAAVQQLAAGSAPLVLVENRLPDPIHAVTADNFDAGLLVTSHLIELGHRRIGALGGPPKYSSLRDRMRGHNVALLEHGLAPEPHLQPAPVSGHPKKGYVQMRQLLALGEPPTAVFAVSDKSAHGAIEAIKEAGLQIPNDISIAAIDDVAESAYSSPPLTTYHVPKARLGQAAVAVMYDLLTDATPPAHIMLIGELIVRGSTAAPRSTHLSTQRRKDAKD